MSRLRSKLAALATMSLFGAGVFLSFGLSSSLRGVVVGSSLEQRIRTYDTGATNPNDPAGLLHCGQTIGLNIRTIYVDITARGLGNLVDGVDLNGANAWEQDQGVEPVTYHQNVALATGTWRFYARLKTGRSAECSIYRR